MRPRGDGAIEPAQKRPRYSWDSEHIASFDAAVAKLGGLRLATATKIQKLMGIHAPEVKVISNRVAKRRKASN